MSNEAWKPGTLVFAQDALSLAATLVPYKPGLLCENKISYINVAINEVMEVVKIAEYTVQFYYPKGMVYVYFGWTPKDAFSTKRKAQ